MKQSIQPKETKGSGSRPPFFGTGDRKGFFQTSRSESSFFSNPSAHSAIQTKLTIGQPNDPYEQQADRMADTFVNRKPIFESEGEPSAEHPSIQRCAACEKEEALQKKETSSDGLAATPAIERTLNASKGGGAPLPEDTKQEMESSFGADFGNVRVHSDSASVRMNKDLEAQAFTHGNDIYFNSGKFDPAGKTGQHLLAHELTHTLQQSSDVGPAPIAQRQPGHSEKSPANLQEQKVVEADPPAEVYIARKSNFYYAIPKTYTSLTQLAKYLFKAANDSDGDGSSDKTSPLAIIRQALKDMNGLIREEVYPMEHIYLGDLRIRFAPTARMNWVTTNTVIFSNDVQNPAAELAKMGASSLDEFFERKVALDAQWVLDRFSLVGLVKDLVHADIPEHLDIEPRILKILERWAHEPLVTFTDNYPDGGQYFDKLLTYLGGITMGISWISYEQSDLYSILFNRALIIRRDLDFYLGKYAYNNRGDKPMPEMSVWSDAVKPALLRIPIAINEETACFIESIPIDGAKDAADWIHGKDQDYANAVLPDEGKANQDTMDIACFFGGVMFDLADPAAEIMELLKGVQNIEDLYKAFKEVDSTIENLPKLLSNFSSTEKLLNILFGIEDSPELNSLETWVNSQQPAGEHSGSPAVSPGQHPAAETGFAKFRKVISDFIGIVKSALRTIFGIRRKFIEFIAQAQDTLVSNPLFVKALMALKAGKKIAELADGNLPEKIIEAVNELLNYLKGEALDLIADFLKTIEGNIGGLIKGIQDRFVNAITDYALDKFSKSNPKVRIALRLDFIKKRAEQLIGEKLVGPFLKRIFLDDMMKGIESVADGITKDAEIAIGYVVGNFSEYIRNSFKEHHLQPQSKDNHNLGIKVASPGVEKGMASSSGHSLPDNTKDRMEGAFGANFDSVRIHHDSHAREASEDLHANAFTQANDIYFNSGMYDPQSKDGQMLLAHELTHVVQQDGGGGPQSIQRSVQDVPRQIFNKILKDFFIKRNPEAKKFAGEMRMLTAQPYERNTRYKVDSPAIDQKLLSMTLEERKRLLGTLKDSFSRNIAVARVIINDDVKNPQYILTRNTPTGQHSEEAIGGKVNALLKKLQKKSAKKAKKKGQQEEKPVTVRVDQLYTERKPCQDKCVPFMNNNQIFNGTKVYFTLPYSMDVNEPISRKEELMRLYGLTQEKILELTKNDL